MELPNEQLPAVYTREENKLDYWDYMMSQVKILPSRLFAANSSLENISLQAQKIQRRVTGDSKKRAAPPASRTASMPELSSEYITHTASPNNQNVNDRLDYGERHNQYVSGSTKCMSNLNHLDNPFTTCARRTQDSPAYSTTNVEIDFGARTEKVQIKDSCMHRKEYVMLVTSDTVKYHQLPKRGIVAIYIINEQHDNDASTLHCIENEKINDLFASVPIQKVKSRLMTRNADQVLEGLSEEFENNPMRYISMKHPHSNAAKSEQHTTSNKSKEKDSSSLISLIIRAEAQKDYCALPVCLQHAKGESSQESLKYLNTFLSSTARTTLPTGSAAESILVSTVHGRKAKISTRSRNGFSSITITARRMMSPANKLSKPTVSASANEKNATQHERSVSSEGIVHIHSHTDNINEFPYNGYSVEEDSSQSQSLLFSIGDSVSSLNIDRKHHETLLPSNYEDKTHLPSQQFHSVVSFVHFIVTPRCFSSTCYLDKSLLIDLCSLTNRNGCGLIQKSSLSLKLSCTSSKSSADGGDGMFKLISFIRRSKQGVAYIMMDKEYPDISSRARDIIPRQSSAAQKVSKTANQYNGDLTSNGKETQGSPKKSAYLFIYLSNMNKGTNYFITEHKYKPNHREMPSPISDLIGKSADVKFSNSHVDLMGKRKRTLKQSREKSTLSMTAKSTGSSTENQGEDTETNLSERTTVREKALSDMLTLREALKLYKPDFIFRSQKRLQELEIKATQRRVQMHECRLQQRKRMGPRVQTIPLPNPLKKRQCTTPHPLSDNLHKPKGRIIPEKEMQMRSKRIYNKLPEVKMKKEEEKKKVVSQTNRLRAMVYKKKLLDQVRQKQ
ncbi:(E2-independent) E3 ubiquitin-conjugating enzyme FATS-like [Leucoraja erinacea]|uniref:(E2-independent) E3 ubiquitin-conjugating enzyme FATS-like n=1 Tax=Leucoraja erinaceus TaxID=7782 RepID=UPI002458763E|nr:(E2-independent) E3 ubiquitin-conjugating enzyme FATS-like [Leucoraja erinacea]XP_055502683.1 (E2-independent) E3 ubiquitin-conjugating enzyme FATS-like [Leucoraja erinacea]